MPLKIALSGATGFVGRNVVNEMLGVKHSVTALVRDVSGANLPRDVRLVSGDLQNTAALDEFTTGADVVIHIAGLISALKREDYFAANKMGTRNVVQAALRHGVKRFVHVSSLSAREPQLSAYGASKLAGEAVLSNDMSTVVLRPPAVYGDGDKATFPLLKALTQPVAIIPGRADARFSLIYVKDLARVIVEAASATQIGIFELHDGSAQGHNWKELATLAAAHENRGITTVFLPKFVPYAVATVSDGVSKLRGKPSMISREKIDELYHSDWVARGPGWPLKNPTGFAQGFADTVSWYRREGWLPQNPNAKMMSLGS
jgi:nucleoside-diphosphate-sugar epimerase